MTKKTITISFRCPKCGTLDMPVEATLKDGHTVMRCVGEGCTEMFGTKAYFYSKLGKKQDEVVKGLIRKKP